MPIDAAGFHQIQGLITDKQLTASQQGFTDTAYQEGKYQAGMFFFLLLIQALFA